MPSALRLTILGLLWLALLAGITYWYSGQARTRLTIAAGPATGESFELAQAIADVVESSYPHIQVDVYETQGTAEDLRLIESGRVDLAAIQADSDISRDVRVVANLFSDVYQLIVTDASGITGV